MSVRSARRVAVKVVTYLGDEVMKVFKDQEIGIVETTMDAHSKEKSEALSRLAELVRECSSGEASGLNPQAVVLAASFVRALPDSIPMPEFAAEPGGDISLDWIASRDRVFSLSVGPTNRLAFAWLDGTNKGHGVEGFDGGQISRRILEGISEIVGDKRDLL